MIPDGTKVFIAMGVLPASTNATVRLALKGIDVNATTSGSLRTTADTDLAGTPIA